jgi:hypothetical protein
MQFFLRQFRKMSSSEVVAARTQSLEDRIRAKWLKPASKLPIAADLPRLLKHIEIKSADGDALLSKPEDTSPLSTIVNFLDRTFQLHPPKEK